MSPREHIHATVSGVHGDRMMPSEYIGRVISGVHRMRAVACTHQDMVMTGVYRMTAVASLHRDIVTAALHGYVAVLFHGERAAPTLNRGRVIAALHGLCQVLLDGKGAISSLNRDRLIPLCDRHRLVLFDGFGLVAVHGVGLVDRHRIGLVGENGGAVVVLDDFVHVELRVNEDFLLAFAVVELDLVVAAATGRTGRTNRADVFGSRESVRNRIFTVVDSANDEWPIGVTFEKLNDDLLAHSWNEHTTLTSASPGLTHANPAGTVVIAAGGSVPVELDLDAAMIIAVNFLAGRTDDYGCLYARDRRSFCGTRWAERNLGGNAGHSVLVRRFLLVRPLFSKCRRLRTPMFDRDDQIFLIAVIPSVATECELVSREHGADGAGSDEEALLTLQLFQA